MMELLFDIQTGNFLLSFFLIMVSYLASKVLFMLSRWVVCRIKGGR